MTPTTSSSSILLLNPGAPSAKGALPSDAAAPSGAASSGFQLLFGAIQQLQQQLTATTAEGEAQPPAAEPADGDGGNASPALGIILPLAGLPPATLEKTAETAAKPAAKKDGDAEAGESAIELMSTPLPLPVVAPPSAQPSGVVIQPPQGDANKAGELAGVTAAVSGFAALNGNAATGAGSALDVQTDSKGGTSEIAGGARNGSGASAAVSSGIGEGAASTLGAAAAAGAKDLPSVGLPPAESSFDALIKQFDAPSTSQSASQAVALGSPGDSANVQQGSRTYLQAANSNASVSVPVGNNGWSEAIADKVMWFSSNKITSAEIHLNPPDLGPLQVRVNTQSDQASVVFTSHHAAVRDALDQALPRLRDMMGSQGVQLDVSVGGQGAQQQQFGRDNSGERAASAAGGLFNENPVEPPAAVTPVNSGRLLRSGVDAYA